MSEINATGLNRPRPKSVLSYESKRSRRSSNSGPKLDLTETSSEKKRLHTKADPSMAMNEAQPAAVALEESNLDNLRRTTWKDMQGNIIADPDLSNPTRSRMERPLDTIRSFEAAVEGTYNSRRSTIAGRPVPMPNHHGANRRSSYFGVNGVNGNPRPQHSGGGNFHQNGRGHGPRPDGVADDYEGREPRYSYPPRVMRNLPSSMIPADNIYPSHSQQSSPDNFTTGGGSYGTDTRGNSTDPSSLNSSTDRFPVKPEEQSGDNSRAIGYSNGPYSPVSPAYNAEQSFWRGANGRPQAPYGRNEYMNGGANGGNGHGSNVPPNVPPKVEAPPVPIKLNSGTVGTPVSPPKRQSWLKRRFSKKT